MKTGGIKTGGVKTGEMTGGLTLHQVLRATEHRFLGAGIDTARLDARVLVGHVLGIEPAHLLMHHNNPFNDTEVLEGLVKRREAREPISHIVGHRGFWEDDFIVTRDVLTPRPDSETLIEAALALVPDDQPVNILDLGTGSGCLILSILGARPKAMGIALDLSSAALAVAQKNAKHLNLSERVTFIEGNFSSAPTGPFTLIVSNPPYIPSSDIITLEPELSYEPSLALDGGADGLDAYRLLAPLTFERTAPGGHVFFEVGAGQAADVALLMQGAGFESITRRRDLAGIERCVIGIRPQTPRP